MNKEFLKMSGTKIADSYVGKDMKKKPTPREYAALRHVWTLAPAEKKHLTRYYILKTTAVELCFKIHEWPDKIQTIMHEETTYELFIPSGTAAKIKALTDQGKDATILLSMRHSRHLEFAAAIVKLADHIPAEDLLKYPEL
jgi:hypothetical protein